MRDQKIAKKFCAAVKIVAKQSTMGCHDVDSIARCLRRNTPSSPGIARSLYSNTTSRSVARFLCRNTPPSPGISRSLCNNTTSRNVVWSLCRNTPLSPAVELYLYSNTMASRGPSAEKLHRHPPSRVPSTETPRRHPASCGHSIVTPRQMSGSRRPGGKNPIYRGGIGQM